MRVEHADGISDAAWDEFVVRHADGWWWHTSSWRAYQRSCGAADYSFALLDDYGEVFAIVPLLVRDGIAAPDGGPEPLVSPRVSDKGHVWKTIFAHASTVGLRRWIFAGRDRRDGLPVPAEDGQDERIRILPLAGSELDLWRGVRRSYHALIHRAEREYVIERYRPGSSLDELMQVHAQAAGRQTRPTETWDLMHAWASVGVGNIWVARDADDAVTAFIYVYKWKGQAYYGHAATLAQNVTHALIWAAIKSLRADVSFLDLGAVSSADDDTKTRGIAMFKRGFGGYDAAVRRVNVTF